MSDISPKQLTLWGWLSFPKFTAQEAFDRNKKGQYPDDSVDKAKPDFEMILTEDQYKKFVDHAVGVFLPYTITNTSKGPRRIDDLDAAHAKQLITEVQGKLEDQTKNTPVKPVKDDVLEKHPDAVATFKVIGPAGGSITQKALVFDSSELADPASDVIPPAVVPIGLTTHKLYAGCMVKCTVQLYSYYNGKNPGFSAKGTTVVFKGDDVPLGNAGPDVDLDEMFADD